WDRAATLAATATTLDPHNLSAWILRGNSAARLGRKQQAAEYFEQAARAAPHSPLPRVLAARARLDLDDVEGAAGQAAAAVRVGPKDPGALTVLGDVLMRRGPEHLAD